MKHSSSRDARIQPPPTRRRPSTNAAPMPSRIFNVLRTCLYVPVLLFTIICLAISAHFLSLLALTDLTRFVPFALFVCSMSIAIILVLLLASLISRLNRIPAKYELASIGFLGILWLALAAFLVSSDSQSADVECYVSQDETQPINIPGFSTETYHAQYRVLIAFSILNTLILWGFFIFLLALALRQHRGGSREVWHIPVTLYPWFSQPGQKNKLPAPVTARRSRSRAVRPTAAAGVSREKSTTTRGSSTTRRPSGRSTSHSRQPSRSASGRHGSGTAPKPPPKIYDKHSKVDKFRRDVSPRRKP